MGARPPAPDLGRGSEPQEPTEKRKGAGLCRLINFECQFVWTRFGAIKAAGAQNHVAFSEIDISSTGCICCGHRYGDAGFRFVEALDDETARTRPDKNRR